MVRRGVRARVESLSKWCMVSIFQRKIRTRKGKLWRVYRLVYEIMEEPECMAAFSSCLLLGVDVGTLLDATMERCVHIRYIHDGRVQLVANHLYVPESCGPDYAETGVVERGEAADWQFDDAGADLQTAYRRQVVATGKICDQESGALLCAKEISNFAHIRAYVLVEYI